MEEQLYEFCDDYAQSANTLFHFMKKPQYLKDILLRKAIVPRYCLENIDYLNISNNGYLFREIYVLQKCFCDIPFHKLTEKFELRGVGKNYQKLIDNEKSLLSQNNTHPDFYGEYAIAFSKGWGEKNNLQPIHYLSGESQYTKELSVLIESVLQEDNVPDIYPDDIMRRLSFVKPLRGIMSRRIKHGGGELEIDFYKNFHDEQEWRYVPKKEALAALKKDVVIANPNLINMIRQNPNINKELANERYDSLWLKYNYEDVRYIIVPDATARIDMINTIMSIDKGKFNSQPDVMIQKYVLISKILVLDEIGKDW